MSIWIWLGIIACIALSAVFAGLNLAIFSLSQLRLQIEADSGNNDAARVLGLRRNSNQVLATVIWGNVGTNVLLTILSDSVLTGFGAFLFSAVVITFLCEIAPQAYFSRNALRMTTRFLPFLIFWRAALFFVAKPTAMLLDWWLGVERIAYLHERHVRSLVARAAASGGDIDKLEAIGVQNFLDLDDLPVTEEGESIHPQSILSLTLADGRCILPAFSPSPDDPFLQRVNASGKKWVIVTDPNDEPAFVLDFRSLPTRRSVQTARQKSSRILAPTDHRKGYESEAGRGHWALEGCPGTPGRRCYRPRFDLGLGCAKADHYRLRSVGSFAARNCICRNSNALSATMATLPLSSGAFNGS